MSEPFIGEIRMFGGNFAPRGWALCQGQLLSIPQNTALFSILGTTFGGDGRTTFGLPDLRGRAPVGMGQGPGQPNVVQGEMAGARSVTLTSNQMPMHTHATAGMSASVAIPVNTGNGTTKTPGPSLVLSQTNDTAAGAEVDLYSAAPGGSTLAPFNASVTGQIGVTGGSQPFDVSNPYLGTNFIIALEGIFPTRS